jgi:DNA-binding response OmpR family regulator
MARILIIDDDNAFRAMLRAMLEEAGYNDIEEADDGDIGAKLFRQRPFDLVITDLIMPNKEGIEMIVELRRDYPLIKIIAVSGGGRTGPQDYLRLARHLGADRTLEKPFKCSELIDTMQGLLNE